ncbi:calcium/proton exchanger [Cryptococcus sp. DSM 104549]
MSSPPFSSPDDSTSSPTPTIRNSTPLGVPPASKLFGKAASSPSPGPGSGQEPSQAGGQAPRAPPAMRRSNSQQQQQELGKGRPGRGDDTSPSRAAPGSPSQVHQPARTLSFSSVEGDDDYYPQAPPRTAAPGNTTFESTPRGWAGGSQRSAGVPQTAYGSSFGSPNAFFNPGAGAAGGSNRLGRGARFASSSREPPQTANPTGAGGGSGGASTSRSASRARPALPHHHSTAGFVPGAGRERREGEDDEFEDRGAELIKQRQRERKAKRKKHQLELEHRRIAEDGVTPETSNPPSGVPGEGFLAQQGKAGSARPRNASTDRRRLTSEGYFPYASSLSGAETPRDGGLSPREELRAPSVYSSVADEEDEGQIEQDRASLVGEIVNDVVEEELCEELEHEEEEDEDEAEAEGDDEGVTLKDRQDAINIEHPFGLPIWKPALYRKSRSVTRNAESALHNIPSAAAERHLLPGNILWVVLFGWWLALACSVVAILVSGAEVLGGGRGGYGKTLRGLAWYIGWPFGKYVEGEGGPEEEHDEGEGDVEQGNGHGHATENGGDYGALDAERGSPVSKRTAAQRREVSDGASSNLTVRHPQLHDSPSGSVPASPSSPSTSTVRGEDRPLGVSFAPGVDAKGKSREGSGADERTSLLGGGGGGAGGSSKIGFRRPRNKRAKQLGRIVYWPGFFLIVAPTMLFVCVLCWCFVITIPMAKLTWALLTLLWARPLEINFRAAPKIPVPTPHSSSDSASGVGADGAAGAGDSPSGFTMKRAHLTAGQVAPTSGPASTVLLCTYRAVGLQYYKYTVGGVNIMFINLLPLVFFTIIDGMVLLPAVERNEHMGRPITPLLRVLTSQALIFVLALASVIPLSYFIGMAVASISAQSSIGMGAVINATFGSVIEIILYSIALTQGKGRLVEGSIVGSILAGVLLMPGASMCSGAMKKKEQKFNAKSAGVTSTMLIMAIIGTLTPTMFYQTYGSFELHCEGCPEPRAGVPPTTSPAPWMDMSGGLGLKPDDLWICDHCYYEHPDPEKDPFYQDSVKTLMYCCAAILLFSYLIGLWFSLRTHAAQIWQNPQQLMKSEEAAALGGVHPALKATIAQRLTPQALGHILPLHKSNTASPAQATHGAGASGAGAGITASPRTGTLKLAPVEDGGAVPAPASGPSSAHPDGGRPFNLPTGYTPFLDSVDQDMKSSSHLTPMRLPGTLTTEDFTRAVAVATVSALRHQGSIIGSGGGSERRHRLAGEGHVHGASTGAGAGAGVVGGAIVGKEDKEEGGEEAGGHEAPSWTRGVSAGVLLGCTLLYAIIAEILVDVVDVVMQGSGIDEKFLGLTLFALVPNTTEFMNAMSFALNGNIALSMEIGSAYALQVCLLQIPAMVAFSALYQPDKMGDVVDTFTLIFPRWDVIAIILSIFLLTYTYIEARSNYHRGSILVLAYVVLIMGFYYAPTRGQGDSETGGIVYGPESAGLVQSSLAMSITKLWG